MFKYLHHIEEEVWSNKQQPSLEAEEYWKKKTIVKLLRNILWFGKIYIIRDKTSWRRLIDVADLAW